MFLTILRILCNLSPVCHKSVLPLEHGQLKLTQAKFYRVSGDSTQHQGVIPDILFPSLFDKEKIGESALDEALAWDTIRPAGYKAQTDFQQWLPVLREKHQDRIETNPDFVYLHIEASDEAGHEGDFKLKTKTVEYLDQRVVKFIVEETAKMDEDVAIAILPDHATPCILRTHTHDPIPFMIYNPKVEGDTVTQYDEQSAENGSYKKLVGSEFIKAFLGK